MSCSPSSARKRRKRRPYEYTCTCPAYRFPHRFGGRRCDGSHLTLEYPANSACRTCNLNAHGICQVQQGQESTRECPIVQEFVEHFEIRMYS